MAAGSLREAINSDNDSSIGITLVSTDLRALYYSHPASGLISFILWMKKNEGTGRLCNLLRSRGELVSQPTHRTGARSLGPCGQRAHCGAGLSTDHR